MILRVGVVICVASIVVALSHPSIARPADQNQNKPNAAATGSAVVGIASTHNPFRPGYRSGAGKRLPASFTIQPPGPLRSKLICVRGLAASAMQRTIDQRTHCFQAKTSRSS